MVFSVVFLIFTLFPNFRSFQFLSSQKSLFWFIPTFAIPIPILWFTQAAFSSITFPSSFSSLSLLFITGASCLAHQSYSSHGIICDKLSRSRFFGANRLNYIKWARLNGLQISYWPFWIGVIFGRSSFQLPLRCMGKSSCLPSILGPSSLSFIVSSGLAHRRPMFYLVQYRC